MATEEYSSRDGTDVRKFEWKRVWAHSENFKGGVILLDIKLAQLETLLYRKCFAGYKRLLSVRVAWDCYAKIFGSLSYIVKSC